MISIRLASVCVQQPSAPSCPVLYPGRDASSIRCQASRQACVTEASCRCREAGVVARRVLLPPRAPRRPPRLVCPQAAALPAPAPASITAFTSFEAWEAVRGLGEWAQGSALNPFPARCLVRAAPTAIAIMLLLLLCVKLRALQASAGGGSSVPGATSIYSRTSSYVRKG